MTHEKETRSKVKAGSYEDQEEEEEDDGEENKLAALNEMLKNKKFAIQREDEEDFEMFLKKLNQKRQQDIGNFLEEHKSPQNQRTM